MAIIDDVQEIIQGMHTIDYTGIIAGVIKQTKTDFETSKIYILRLWYDSF